MKRKDEKNGKCFALASVGRKRGKCHLLAREWRLLFRGWGWPRVAEVVSAGEREQAECGIFVGCRRDDCCRGDGPEQQH